MAKREFLLSNVHSTLDRNNPVNLVSFGTSALLGLVAVLLAVVAIVAQFVSTYAILSLFVLVLVSMGLIIFVVLYVPWLWGKKAKLLGRWRIKIFFSNGVEDLSEEEIHKFISLIGSVEACRLWTHRKEKEFDSDFIKMLAAHTPKKPDA